ncbi:MAG: hypothetical protein DCC71_15730 [Proteobacteria bacterium]|nr:MAG: hypothetical protein DCC71_15730 [Pseudomonadota bacterium]
MGNATRQIAIRAQRTDDAPDPVLDEVARLELLRRMTMGAAHTLNNAFTAILGETLCLLDERKSDPVVAEACQLIQGEIERCARLARSVALRVQRRRPVLDETDAAALVGALEPLLRETVSRSIAIECDVEDAPLGVRGATEELEPLVLLCAHRLVRGVRSGGVLRVAARREAGGAVVLELALEAKREPEREAGAASWDALVARSLRSLAERHGVELHEESGRDRAAVALRLPPAPL